MNPRMTKHKTLTEYQREEINNVVVNTLGEQYATLRLVHLTIKEDVIEETTEIKCDMLLGGKKLTVKGAGNGPIDALFTALVKKFSPEYCSLENLHFTRFSVEADISKGSASAKTDATVEATLEIDNESSSLLFRERANSISVVSAKVAVSTIEHFINSEKCVIMLYNNLQYAKERRRGDMVVLYTQKLAEVVKNVSYEKVIEKCKREKKR